MKRNKKQCDHRHSMITNFHENLQKLYQIDYFILHIFHLLTILSNSKLKQKVLKRESVFSLHNTCTYYIIKKHV